MLLNINQLLANIILRKAHKKPQKNINLGNF